MEVLIINQAPIRGVERDSVRLAAVLLLAGVLVTAIAGFLHPEGADANDHQTGSTNFSGVWSRFMLLISAVG
jgi:hypothetical protein